MIDSIKQDAKEYGLHLKAGGWRLGLLVARNVEKGKGNGRPKKDETFSTGKVSAAAFAKAAGTSAARVLRHLDAWDTAAEAGHVPAAAALAPGKNVPLDAEKLPGWGDFYTSVSGGYNGGKDRQPTAKQAAEVIAALPAAEAAAVIATALDTPEIIEALDDDDEAVDHVLNATTKLAGIGQGEKVKKKKSRKMQEMTVVLALMGVLGQIRDLAKEDSDSPLIKECKNLMRETLEILDGIEEADDPDVVDQMLTDFGDFLSAQ